MRTFNLWASATFVALSTAFQDTSPFFLISTSELPSATHNLVSAAALSRDVLAELEKCPSDSYIIVSQPGVTAADFGDANNSPHLRMLVRKEEQAIHSSTEVKDVLGSLNINDISKKIEEVCGAERLGVDASTGSFTLGKTSKPRVVTLNFPKLSLGKDRALKLAEHDAFLASLLSMLPTKRYTILYTTTPPSAPSTTDRHTNAPKSKPESEAYTIDTDFQSPLHMEMKRDFQQARRDEDGEKIQLPDGPLFERYQFLTPGLFMGLLAAIILGTVLYVGISGISGLTVTYAAFDKEMGPASQKGKQQ